MKEVITDILNGNKEAYRLIIQNYAPAVRTYLASRLSNHHSVEDLTQDVFISAYQALERFDLEQDFRPWLLTITRNKLMTHLRKHYSKESFNTVLEEEVYNKVHDDSVNSQKEEQVEKLHSCLGKQNEHDREILKSRYFSSESVSALAERLDITESSICSRLYRLRRILKSCMEHSS